MNSVQANSAVIIIPSRYGSTRFPGKPLAIIAGRSLLQRVWLIAKAVPDISQVIVATDDERIRAHAASFGAECLMTSPQCRNGSERACEVMEKLPQRPGIIVNLQGDAVLTPPHVIAALLDAMRKDASIELATPAVRLSETQRASLENAKQQSEVSGTYVVFDTKHRALYFSRAPIPNIRKSGVSASAFRHIGIYAYRPAILERLVKLPPTPLEQAEQLEQLRALEHGIPIAVVEVDYHGRTAWSVDAPDDVKMVERILASEGEPV